MGLAARFASKVKEDPAAHAAETFAVLGSLPSSLAGRHNAIFRYRKSIEEDLAALKLIRSLEQRRKAKQETLLPKYMPAVQSLMAAGESDSLISQVMVWTFDVGDIGGAIKMALYCIEHEIASPFRRDIPTFLADAVLTWAEDEIAAGRSVEPWFGTVFGEANVWDLSDVIRARFHRLAGKIAFELQEYAVAVAELERAMALGARVRTLLAQSRKKLENA